MSPGEAGFGSTNCFREPRTSGHQRRIGVDV